VIGPAVRATIGPAVVATGVRTTIRRSLILRPDCGDVLVFECHWGASHRENRYPRTLGGPTPYRHSGLVPRQT
jgi:hypothetical protein